MSVGLGAVWVLVCVWLGGAAGLITQEPLPYALDALEPHLSRRNMELHFHRHHAAYVAKANALLPPDASDAQLPELLRRADGPLRAHLGQHFNHQFFWRAIRPGGGGSPGGALLEKIERQFGSIDEFRSQFKERAAKHFGSGWAWLTMEPSSEELRIETTANGDFPTRSLPLLTLDLWEHSWYPTYENRKADYIESYLQHLVNWPFAENLYDEILRGKAKAEL